jgi:hypothetical protein
VHASKSDGHKEGGRVLIRERTQSSHARGFGLPVELDPERLKLELVKRSKASATGVEIN